MTVDAMRFSTFPACSVLRRRTQRFLAIFFCLLGYIALNRFQHGHAQSVSGPQWIWFDEGDSAKNFPAGVRYFRRIFDLDRPVDEAILDITADKQFTVWLNGIEIGNGDDWRKVRAFDVKGHVIKGKNVLTVEVRNDQGRAGLLARLGYVPNGQSKLALVSDGMWKASRSAAPGWQRIEFDDHGWSRVRVLGQAGKTEPWKGIIWESGGDERFSVPPGFRVELAVRNPNPKDPFSLLNLTFDARGRLLGSREGGPVLLCTGADKDGVLGNVKPFCDQVRGCQGMCCVGDALYLVGDGPQGTGLYRVRDIDGDDKADEVKLLHKFVGSMGEHGPHAVLFGPDGCLYLVLGNGSWAKPEKLAANSPLTRWPDGQMGPEQVKPGSTEDILLPYLMDPHELGDATRAPGGTVWRCNLDGKNMALVAAGLRNAYDAAFNSDGELFTFDSDMEWDEGLPWYQPVRIRHLPPGADYLWRDGSANTPDYYIDSLPPALNVGRGSPVGVTFYDHTIFPEKYRGCCFMADWSLGRIYAVWLEQQRASYKARLERFCQGTPMNVTDLAVGPDGALYFTMGGRGTQGGVYRIVYEREKRPQANHDTPRASRSPDNPRDRAKTTRWLGIRGDVGSRAALLLALADEDAQVRRCACEALIRANIEPPVDAVWPLLREEDRFVRTAARLVLQRIDAAKWVNRLWKEQSLLAMAEGMVALCKTGQASRYTNELFARLKREAIPVSPESFLVYLRTLELALIHAGSSPEDIKAMAARCWEAFPQKDWRVNRELAIVLAYFRSQGLLREPVHAELLKAMLDATNDRQQQIHYFYCLRLLHDGWTAEQKDSVLKWYDATRDWVGGHSFHAFLEAILRDTRPMFTADDATRLIARGDQLSWAATGLLRVAEPRQLPAPQSLASLYERLTSPAGEELKEAVLDALGRSAGPEAEALLRKIADRDLAHAETAIRSLARFPSSENQPYFLRGLVSGNPLVLFDMIEALKKTPDRPKTEDPAPFRALLLAANRLDAKSRWKAVELLRHWSGDKRFGAEDGDWKEELTAWRKWFAQAFPREPALPGTASDTPAESKYKFDELLALVEKGAGDAKRGRNVIEKANCFKCHRIGKEGEGVGPDLTAVSKRFKRADVLESILYPSKVISDQYRSSTFITKRGQQITGLATAQGDRVVVLQSDGTKVTLRKDEIEKQVASLVSVMPERLLDPLSKEEIADLFAFLEATPE